MNIEKLKQRFDAFNFYSYMLLTPYSGRRKGYLALAAVIGTEFVIDTINSAFPKYDLPIVAGLLTARMGYNAWEWAPATRQNQPVWARKRGWEQFDRQIQFVGEAVTGLAAATLTIGLILQGSDLASAPFAATARQILVLREIAREIGGIRNFRSYRSSQPSPANRGPFL